MSKQFPPKSSLPAIWGAAAAAVGASVCCVLPLVLVLMGISGAWIANLTALDAWRPWLSALTVLCLGWAFWTLYRSDAQRCSTEGACMDPVLLRRRRRWFWIASGVIVLLLLFPYYIGWIL
ncbi:mercuric transporter MerT family protein [Pseudoxanthomonas sp.]|jgi:mercuric ion transport protein|uniref:mercuric transporter MerT family protein n=1 Tax=Pseudoxanthomonas sp. TaxID=1871049 RepID=UPI002FE38ED3